MGLDGERGEDIQLSTVASSHSLDPNVSRQPLQFRVFSEQVYNFPCPRLPNLSLMGPQ
jgi:hypothetical protein